MPTDPSNHFEIGPFTEEAFLNAFCNSHCSFSVVSEQLPVKYLFRYLTELMARTILVELNYVDGDYLDDFSSYYVRCFQKYDRICRRIHFFSEDYTSQHFLNILGKSNSDPDFQTFSKEYLGFVVVRPLPGSVVGRTILKTYPPDNGRRFYPGTRKYYPNLFGIKMELESLAFQQQDSVLAACATVALWSCYHKTNDLFGTPCPRPATITRVANQVVADSRPFPSRGLQIIQICNSIRKLELEPEVFNVNGDVPLVSLIYGYMRMGLPVLLAAKIEGVGLHALTLVGYALNGENVRPSEVFGSAQSIPMMGLRIEKFYAHDDQIGPFSRLSVNPGTEDLGPPRRTFPVIFKGSWEGPVGGQFRCIYPMAVIVPVYNKIRLNFLDIKIPLERLNSLIDAIKNMSDVFGDIKKEEWDVHLITNNAYKEEVKTQAYYGDSIDILLMAHPKFIWRTLYKVNDKIIIELLADATDVKLECPFYKMEIFGSSLISILKLIFNNEQVPPDLTKFLIKLLKEPFYCFLKEQTNISYS